MSRVLYLAPFCHIPPIHGASQRGIHLLLELARYHTVTLLTYRKHDAGALEQWAAEHNIALRWLPDPPVQHSASFIQRLFARLPPGFASHSPEAIADAIDRVSAEHGPFDLIYLATQIFGQAALCRRWPARMVLDLYDVYTPIAQSKVAQVSLLRPYHWLFRLEALRIRRYEMRIFEQYDMILVPSAQEAAQVARLAVGAAIEVIPNGVALPPAAAPAAHERIILMVASYTYAPNAEGFRWFYQQVWPAICRHDPHASLVLVGEGNDQLRRATAGDARIHWAGKVPDLSSYYRQAACVIVPIHSGGGTRLKLIEAMAWAAPVVSTSLGAQGIEHDNSIAIADTPEQFAHAVLQRLAHPGAFNGDAQRARAVIAAEYTWDRVGAKLCAAVE